jgi:transposase
MKRGRAGGVEALKIHPPTGVKPRLSAEQKAQLPALLAKGAEAYGFRGDVWTASRVAEVIHHTFGVRYHRDHVGRLLREAGWSRQQPLERATQRDAEAIKQWYEERWPALKKSRRGAGYHCLGRRSGFLSAADGGAHVGERLCCGYHSRAIISPLSVASLLMGACFCKFVLGPMMRQELWASCVCCCARYPERSW